MLDGVAIVLTFIFSMFGFGNVPSVASGEDGDDGSNLSGSIGSDKDEVTTPVVLPNSKIEKEKEDFKNNN